MHYSCLMNSARGAGINNNNNNNKKAKNTNAGTFSSVSKSTLICIECMICAYSISNLSREFVISFFVLASFHATFCLFYKSNLHTLAWLYVLFFLWVSLFFFWLYVIGSILFFVLFCFVLCVCVWALSNKTCVA